MHIGAIITIVVLLAGGWYLHGNRAHRAATPVATTTASAVAGVSSTGTLSFGTVARTYVVHLPEGYDASKTYPLMISLHGNGGTGAAQESKTGFSDLADKEGFIAVYPDSNPGYRTGGQWQLTGSGNDVDFVMALIASLQKAYAVDPSRIYLSGHSEGGGLTHALACTHTSTFAGFAVVSNNLNNAIVSACHPATPITALYFHGTKDPVSLYAGGNYKGGDTLSALQTAEYWVTADGCAAQSSSTSVPDTLTPGGAVTDTKQVWAPCKAGTSVTFYTIDGGGHDWPGGTPAKNSQLGPHASLGASQIIWDTLSAARR
jgi:polyhydroxybutyrate depolymerase